jgi:hypothetical protein
MKENFHFYNTEHFFDISSNEDDVYSNIITTYGLQNNIIHMKDENHARRFMSRK